MRSSASCSSPARARATRARCSSTRCRSGCRSSRSTSSSATATSSRSSTPRGRTSRSSRRPRPACCPSPSSTPRSRRWSAATATRSGYETLVRQIARASVDKSSRFTDWSRRPLSQAQMTYALADVTHLRQIYEVLAQQLEETGRGGLGRGGARGPDRPRHLPHRARPRPGRGSRPARPRRASSRRCASSPACARRMAQSRNVPRARILKDDALLELAANRPAHRSRSSASRGCCCARRGGARSPTASSPRSPRPMRCPAAEMPQPPSSRRASRAPRRSPTCCGCSSRRGPRPRAWRSG